LDLASIGIEGLNIKKEPAERQDSSSIGTRSCFVEYCTIDSERQVYVR